MKKNKIINIFTFYLSLIPILNSYSSGISGISIAMLVSSLFVIYGLYDLVRVNRIVYGRNGLSFLPLYLVFILFLISLIVFLFDPPPSMYEFTYTFMKLLMWGLMISICGYSFVDIEKLKINVILVAYVSSIYSFIQIITYNLLNHRLPNIFNIGPLKPNYEYFTISDGHLTNLIYRPSSFFGEPSHLGYYLIFASIILLFDKSFNIKNKAKYLVFISVSLLISSSTSGIVSLIFLVIIFLMYEKSFLNFLIKILIPFFLVLGYGFIGKSNSVFDIYQKNFSKLEYNIIKILNYNNLSRVGGSFQVVSHYLMNSKFLGKGIGHPKELGFLNSFASIYAWSGYIGIFMFLIFIVNLFKRSKNFFQYILVFIYFVTGFYSSMYFGPMSFLYIIMILYD